jgi:hypothetical protein
MALSICFLFLLVWHFYASNVFCNMESQKSRKSETCCQPDSRYIQWLFAQFSLIKHLTILQCREFVEFPGGHNGHVLHPRAFTARLHEVFGDG